MHKRVLRVMGGAWLAILVLTLGAPVWAAELYKYQDASGNTVFSDKPPERAQPAENVRLNVPAASGATVTLQGSVAFCGQLQLGDLARPADIKRMLNSNSIAWQRQLTQALKDYQVALQNSLHASASYQAELIRGSQQRVADLQCAVAWADRMAHDGKIDDRVRDSIAGYEAQIAVLEKDRDRYCGPDPFPGLRSLGDEKAKIWSAWYECATPFAKQIDVLKREKQLGQSSLNP